MIGDDLRFAAEPGQLCGGREEVSAVRGTRIFPAECAMAKEEVVEASFDLEADRAAQARAVVSRRHAPTLITRATAILLRERRVAHVARAALGAVYTHKGTHIDALNHFSLDGQIFNGFLGAHEPSFEPGSARSRSNSPR